MQETCKDYHTIDESQLLEIKEDEHTEEKQDKN